MPEGPFSQIRAHTQVLSGSLFVAGEQHLWRLISTFIVALWKV